MAISPFKLSILILINSLIAGVYSSVNFKITNNCTFTVWPGILTYPRSNVLQSASISTSGFVLEHGESRVVTAPASWEGRIWGRTDCREDSSGIFSCVTGDCGTGKIECAETRNVLAISLAVFRLNGTNGFDSYAVNLIYGYNLPLRVVPEGGSGVNCTTIGCVSDVNIVCPSEMRVTAAGGETIACRSACQAFIQERYCCQRSEPTECDSTFSQVFKRACPQAHSYLYDGQNTAYSCTGANYNIVFCPLGSTRWASTPNPPPSSSSKGMMRPIIIIIIVVCTVALIMLVVALIAIRKIKRSKRDKNLRELLTLDGYTETRGAKNHDLRFFTYEFILSATNNFSLENKLGEGGFGYVYKGKTPEGQDIAVKLLSRQSGQGLLEFKTELILISKLQHVNLVKLHGLCIRGEDKMIIYDYMPNQSLDFFLFDPSKRGLLNWQQRLNIIEGIAQGILYLHKYSRLKIIHRDLKPSNILLDENMNAKISDFGLARVFEQNIDEANTNRRVGTYGYMAPEYAMQGIFSVKSDVYSFGVLVLEIVSGRRNSSFNELEGPLNLVEYAWELWRRDHTVELMDPTLRDSCVSKQLERCIHIALLCLEDKAVDRPTSEDVLLMLKSETTILAMPKNPAFIARNDVSKRAGKRDSETNQSLTLSEIGGR